MEYLALLVLVPLYIFKHLVSQRVLVMWFMSIDIYHICN